MKMICNIVKLYLKNLFLLVFFSFLLFDPFNDGEPGMDLEIELKKICINLT